MKCAVDTNFLIYILEGHPQFGQMALDVMQFFEQNAWHVYASELVYMETESKPGLSEKTIAFLQTNLRQLDISFHPVSQDILHAAARLRRLHQLSLPDAIHIATAQAFSAAYFITNDEALSKKEIPNLAITLLPDFGRGINTKK